MEVLYWVCLLFLLNSALSAGIASIIRVYLTWLNMDQVVAMPEDLMRSIEKERQEKKNKLVYHDKAE